MVTLDPSAGPTDVGLVPLAAFVDGAGDDGSGDAIAVTLEADGTGAVYPVLYYRHGGKVDERPMEPDVLLRFDTPAVRGGVRSVVDEARELV